VKRLLVTGRHGFVGATLAGMLAQEAPLREWHLVDTLDGLDLRERRDVAALVGGSPPDAVIHLAAQSFVPDAFRDPAATLQVNLLGTLNLLQALREVGFAGRMIHVSSGDVYGLVPEEALPVAETWLPVPRNPYAVSKLAAEALCRQWAITEGMDIVVARPFNHIGWGQSDRGCREPKVMVGDIDVTRDFTDVRDVVHAYFALLRAGVRGEVYNVCSGCERSIRSILMRFVELAGVDVAIEAEPARMRKAEQRRMRGDPSKIQAATGWKATTPLDESLAGMLRYWENEGKQ
jgi:GDP-4-dehydro-6-deoxy-D-mannose reductase